jgi:hypothetical protein
MFKLDNGQGSGCMHFELLYAICCLQSSNQLSNLLPPIPLIFATLELIEKLETNESSDFFLFKILRAHILPLTNCAFNKSGM